MASDFFHCKDQNKVGLSIYKKARYGWEFILIKKAKIKLN